MPLNEFDIIATYFKRPHLRDDVALGSGDDCAVLCPPPGKRLLVTVDTLNEGVHFFPTTSPFDIGYKSIAVSLSDIAAMGGEPLWAAVALTIPLPHADWLEDFSKGLYACLDRYQVALVGGNLTRGPLAVSTQLLGACDPKHYLTRHGARPGDLIYVTGTLGEGGLALAFVQNPERFKNINAGQQEQLLKHLWQPTPRLAEGKLLSDIATAAIDISDGLVADLQHILEASEVGGVIDVNALPVTKLLPEKASALTSADDYELCFTIAQKDLDSLAEISRKTACLMTCIGRIEEGRELRVLENGESLPLTGTGYRHF